MKLTEDEARYLETHAKTLEKRARQWKWFRYVIAVSSLSVIAVDFYMFREFRTAFSGAPFSLGENARRVSVDQQAMEAYVSATQAFLKIELILHTTLYVTTFLLMFIFSYTMSNWNKHKRDTILARYLREMVKGADTPNQAL